MPSGQTPRDMYESLENFVTARSATSSKLSNEIEALISNRQVTRAKVKNIQDKRDRAMEVWRNGWDTINNQFQSGYEKNSVLNLINEKITNLNYVQDSLNQLYRVV